MLLKARKYIGEGLKYIGLGTVGSKLLATDESTGNLVTIGVIGLIAVLLLRR